MGASAEPADLLGFVHRNDPECVPPCGECPKFQSGYPLSNFRRAVRELLPHLSLVAVQLSDAFVQLALAVPLVNHRLPVQVKYHRPPETPGSGGADVLWKQ